MPDTQSGQQAAKFSVNRFAGLVGGAVMAVSIVGGAIAQQGSFDDPFYGGGQQNAQTDYQRGSAAQANARTSANVSADLSTRLQSFEDRLYRLERDVEGLVRLGGGQRGPGGSSSLDVDAASTLSLRLSALESEIASMTGLIEEMRHQLMMEQETSRKAREDVEFRLRAIEGRLSGGAGIAPPPTAGGGEAPRDGGQTQVPPDDLFASPMPDGEAGAGTDVIGQTGSQPVTIPPMEPKELYQRSMQQLAQRDYVNAEASLTTFIERHGDHPLTPNAQYWLGESHYARNDYKQAAAAFLAGVRNYPNSNKAPDSMLKLAMSLNQLGLTAQACGTLKELQTRHIKLSAKIAARVAREEQAMSCQ